MIDESGLLLAIRKDDTSVISEAFSRGLSKNYSFSSAPESSEPILCDKPQLISVAAYFGAFESVKFLTNSGSLLNLRDNHGRFPIHFAAASKKIEIFRWILDCGAELRVNDFDYMGPIHYAAKYGSLEILQSLWVQGDSISETASGFRTQSDLTPLHLSAESGFADCVNFLLDNGAEVDPQDQRGQTPLHMSSQNGFVDVSSALISHGANIAASDNQGETPLQRAIRYEKDDVAELILKSQGARTLYNDALLRSAAAGRERLVNFLLNAGVDPNIEDEAFHRTPLHYAVRERSMACAKALIENGADVDFEDNDMNTPLHSAVIARSNDIVSILLQYGANPKLKNINGKTPIDLAKSIDFNEAFSSKNAKI